MSCKHGLQICLGGARDIIVWAGLIAGMDNSYGMYRRVAWVCVTVNGWESRKSV